MATSLTIPATESALADASLEDINDLTFRLMWRLRQDAIKAFEPLGLKPFKVFVLELIGRGMMHPKDLAEMLDAAPSAVSALIASLEEQGLIAREMDPQDRRRVCLVLTDKGRALREQVKDVWHDLTAARFAQVAPQDLEALRRVYLTLLGEA